MDTIIKKKRGLELVITCSSGYETSLQKFLYQLSKILPSLINSFYHKLFHFYLSFSIQKVWKGRGKITKISRTKSRVRILASHFAICDANLSFCDRNNYQVHKNAKQNYHQEGRKKVFYIYVCAPRCLYVSIHILKHILSYPIKKKR